MERKKIKVQDSFKDPLSDSFILKFDIQSDNQPTEPLLHTNSRFLYILEGYGKIKIQNEIYEMKSGSVISILPWQISEIIEVSEQLTYYLLVYNFNLINIYIKNEFNIENENLSFTNPFYNCKAIVYPGAVSTKFKNIFDDLKNEVGISSFELDCNIEKYSSIYLMAKLAELSILFLRFAGVEDTDLNKNHGPDNIFIYMFLNCSKDLSLKLLSKVFLMSESAISKYIGSITGLGFYELLNEMRIFKAKFLLTHTNLSVKDIANTLNYTDSGQLTKIFLNKYHICPTDFKKMNSSMESLVNIRLEKKSLDIINYIYDNFEEDLDISTVSGLFKVSPKQLNEILNYYVEKNFYGFLNQLRICKACDLLVETDFPITEISLMVGYNSTKTFARNFLKNTSMTPSEFRNSYSY